MKLEEENKALVRELTEQIWNRRRVDQIPNFYSPDFVADYRPYAPERRGYDGIKSMVEGTWAAFPDYHEEIQELIAEGDRVVVHLVNSGTQAGQWGPLPPTGKHMEITEIVILQMRDRKVIHQRGVVTILRHYASLASFHRHASETEGNAIHYSRSRTPASLPGLLSRFIRTLVR